MMEAIYHVVEHFSQHTGQIIFATKLLTGQDLGYYRHLNQPETFRNHAVTVLAHPPVTLVLPNRDREGAGAHPR